MKLAESIRKNKDDIKGIMQHTYPDFVFRGKDDLIVGTIPVFNFHDLTPEKFEIQLKYLFENKYVTINADTLLCILSGEIKPIDKAVVLTFDDGLESLWSIAFPLLKKYGFVGISFIIPNLISNNNSYYPNLVDVWNKKSSLDKLLERDKISPLCTWSEIIRMHESGVIDFQSHSLTHGTVYINDKIVDFVNPAFKPNFLSIMYNPLASGNFNYKLREIKWGLPIYESDSVLSTERRYIANETVNEACIKFVEANGGENFFQKTGWRKQLLTVHKRTKSKFEKDIHYQSITERLDDIAYELSTSKKEIELKLNKSVDHLCLPWYRASGKTINIAKEVNYKGCYWGIVKNKSVNKVGDNPFFIKRINHNFIFSLPGKKRKPIFKVLEEKWFG